MTGSQNINTNLLLCLYQDKRSVFRLIDVAMLCGETQQRSLSKKLNYYVRKGQLENPRKGIYAKKGYNPEELACILYTPSYISLGYILQKAGIVFQFDRQITAISYLSRSLEVDNQSYRYRKIKNSILLNPTGIIVDAQHVSTAIPERAFLDKLYLEPDFYFDNLTSLDRDLINKLLTLYQSKSLTDKIKNYFHNV